jgi:hypothetical protein
VRTVNNELVSEYAEKIRPLLSLASKAYGTQGPNSPARQASDKVNEYLKEYVDQHHGNVTHLAAELEGDITLAGLRRRLRAARKGHMLGSLSTSRKRGSKDPERVKKAAYTIAQARNVSSTAYGEAVRDVYTSGVSLSAVAKEMDIAYYSLWSAASHN